MLAKNVVQWQDLNKNVTDLMDLRGLRRVFRGQHALGVKWADVRHDALLAKDCLRDLGVALNAAMGGNGQKPVKVFATPHSQAFMQDARAPFGQILKPQNNHVGPVYVQTHAVMDCLDRLAAERPGKAAGYAFVKAVASELQQKSVCGTILMMGTAVIGGQQRDVGRRHYPAKPSFNSTRTERQADRDRILREGLEGPDGGFVEDPLVARFRGYGSREELKKAAREIGGQWDIRF